jgi:hypothetical protein
MACSRLASITLCWMVIVCLGSRGVAKQAGQTGTASAGTNASAATGASSSAGTSADSVIRPRSMGSVISQPGRRPQPLFITGIVQLEDGSAPPAGVVIERICGARTTKEAFLGSDGTFSFQVGAANNVFPDATDDTPNGFLTATGSAPTSVQEAMNTSNRLMGCDVRASLGGYRSSVMQLNVPQTMGYYNIGALVLYPATRVAGTAVSVTSMAAPKGARKSFESAEKSLAKKDAADAERLLQKALVAYPHFAMAWYRLGQVYVMSGRREEARSAFAKGLAADGNFVGPYVELARMAAIDKNWQETADLSDRALQVNPLDFPYGYYLHALSNYNLNRLDIAEKSSRMLERLDGQHRYPEVFLLLANIFHRRHDIAGEAAQLGNYLKYAPRASNADQVRARLERLDGIGGIPHHDLFMK